MMTVWCLVLLSSLASAISTGDLRVLNSTVSGRLFQATPFSRPCFPSADPNVGRTDAAQCSLIIENYRDRDLRSQSFGSYMNTEWETCQANSAQCLLDAAQPNNTEAFTSRTCDQGSVPAYFIDVQDASDVVAAFKFSKQTRMPLVIKNTGHDYKGRSSAPKSLALWMHNFQSLSFNPEFIPQGCHASTKPVMGATVGAGVTHQSLYTFADQHNITIPGGTDPSVGFAGGYLMGGGHSALSNTFGLAVDRLLEAQIVTPTGQVLTANACQNEDLFFAIRGGGGGTFGVLLEITTLALPHMSLPTVTVSFTNSTKNQRAFMEFMVSHAQAFAESGWGGFISPSTGLIFTNPTISEEAVNVTMADLQSLIVNELNGTFLSVVEPSYFSFFQDFLIPTDVPVGVPFAVTSRLIPVQNFNTASNQANLVDTLLPVLNNQPLDIIFATAPFQFSQARSIDELTGNTSVTPAWRNSLWHVTTSDLWDFDTTSLQRQQIYSSLSRGMDKLRDITPGSGAYQNEADVFEPNFESSFWGANYAKLLSIKNKYDPEHLLDCWQCVGWQGPQASRFSCYMDEALIRK